MTEFKSLDQDEIWRLLEGHVDVLTPLIQKEQSLFKSTPCPACRSSDVSPFVNPSRPFSPGSPLPNKLLRCTICRAEFDPYSGIITRASIIESG